MTEDLRSLLTANYGFAEGDGKKVSHILKTYPPEEIYSGLKELLRSIYPAKYEGALNFIRYLYWSCDFIPGSRDEVLLQKIKDGNLIQEALSFYEEKKAYVQLDFLFAAMRNLPFELSKEKIEQYIRKYEKENPVLLAQLLNVLIDSDNSEALKARYEKLSFEAEDAEFAVRYFILETVFIDNFDKDECFKRLRNICPDKFKNTLENKIAENQKLLSLDCAYDDEVETENDEILFLIAAYFEDAEKAYQKGQSLTFQEFIKGGCCNAQ